MTQLRFIGKIIFIVMAIAWGQNNPSSAQNQTIAGWKTYEQNAYKIQYPDSLELNTLEALGDGFILFFNLTSSDDKFRENINLVIQDLRGEDVSLDDYVKISENEVKTLIANGTVIESARIKTDRSDFHKIIYIGKYGQFDLKFEQYYMVKNDIFYILTLTTEREQFDNYIGIGEQIMNSFEIK